MLALLALFVVGATAAPQVPLYQYPVYPQYYAPQSQYYVQPQPQYRYVPAAYPNYYYPGAVSPVQASTRGIFGLPDGLGLPGFLQANAGFVTSGTVQIMQGRAEFKQNFLTGNGASYEVYMRDSTNGNLKVSGNKYFVYVHTSCPSAAADITTMTGTTGALLAEVTAPSFLVNGFYAKGTTDTFNVDGSNSKTMLRGRYVVVLDSTKATTVGCTGALV